MLLSEISYFLNNKTHHCFSNFFIEKRENRTFFNNNCFHPLQNLSKTLFLSTTLRISKFRSSIQNSFPLFNIFPWLSIPHSLSFFTVNTSLRPCYPFIAFIVYSNRLISLGSSKFPERKNGSVVIKKEFRLSSDISINSFPLYEITHVNLPWNHYMTPFRTSH